MSFTASRTVLRHSQLALRRTPIRHASTTSEAVNAAKDRASQLTAKASESLTKLSAAAGPGLTKLSAAAGPALSKAGTYASGAIGRVGGRTGRLIGFVQSLIPQTVYYSKVGLELGKIVFEQRKMSPPSMATFQSYFQPILNGVRQPATYLSQITAITGTLQPANVLFLLRSLSRQQLASVGVIAAEVLGFFTVGEMIGRFKIVGYRSSAPAHH